MAYIDDFIRSAPKVTSDPTVSDDTTKGYTVGSYWFNTSSGNTFVCIDPSEGAAVWRESSVLGGVNLLNKLDATTDPTAGDDSGDGYSVNSVWLNLTDDKAFICVDSTESAAVWKRIDLPLNTKGDLLGFSTVPARLGVGTNGQIVVADSAESVGLRWTDPAQFVEESFATVGTETPDETLNFSLTATPGGGGTADTPSGYNLAVYQDGVKMKYAASPSAYTEYFYDSGSNEIDVKADGEVHAYEILMLTPTALGSGADTKTFQGTWASVSTISFGARPGQPSTVSLTLQDGKQRSLDVGTPVTWDEANGVADLGYDEAGSQGDDKWKYWYAVPSSGNDNVLSIRASDNPPSTGPTGYSNWKYIWSCYDNGGDLNHIRQDGNWFHYNNMWNGSVYSGNGAGYIENEGSYSSVDISGKVPATAVRMEWYNMMTLPATTYHRWILSWSYDGTAQSDYLYARGNIDNEMNSTKISILHVPSGRTIYRRRQQLAGTGDLSYISYVVRSWQDGWIDP